MNGEVAKDVAILNF